MLWLNGAKIVNKRFPNNELLLNTGMIIRNHAKSKDLIEFKYETDADLIELYLVSKYLRDTLKVEELKLYVIYMPYSRMDRVKNEQDAFTLRYITDMINSIGFDDITLYEPHSDVAPALLNAHSHPIVSGLIEGLYNGRVISDNDYLFFPDSSAFKKYEDIALLYHLKQLSGLKVRDWATGRITEYKVLNPMQGTDVPLDKNAKVFIVDDLCAKGTTAWNAGKSLKAMGFEDIYLVVAHCEDSIFEGKLLDDDSPVKLIYTTNTIITKEHKNIRILEKYY